MPVGTQWGWAHSGVPDTGASCQKNTEQNQIDTAPGPLYCVGSHFVTGLLPHGLAHNILSVPNSCADTMLISSMKIKRKFWHFVDMRRSSLVVQEPSAAVGSMPMPPQ